MESAGKPRKGWKVFALCLFLSALFLLICTKSSFLYPLNDWVDSNIYFTIGKGMMHGHVPYADLYDQKGPNAFFLYGLCSLVSDTSFLGVYLAETLAFALFLYIAYRILSLYVDRGSLLTLPLIAAAILQSLSFSHGGSLEEFCMPLFAWSLYETLRYFKTVYPKPVSFRTLVVNGLLAGWMLFGKFTLLAFYVAWMGVMLVSQLIQRQWKRGIVGSLLFVGAMLATGIPWVIYFGVNGALRDFFYYYFYSNIFGYSYIDSPVLLNTLLVIGKDILAFFYRNPQIGLLITLGVLYVTTRKKAEVLPIEKINLWCLCVLLTAGIYCGGQGYRYYGLVLTPFMILGFVPLLRLWNAHIAHRLTKRGVRIAAFSALTAAMLAVSLWATDNRYMLLMKRDETPQHRFAAIMNERKTQEPLALFCCGCPDGGFYLAADVIPAYRFFATANVSLPELQEAQGQYLTERSAEFIVTRNRELSQPGYELIEAQTFWGEDYDHVYRLYQRVD